jgi:xylulose-5-phosphate/fructose-6-phosphate phosphoketolase
VNGFSENGPNRRGKAELFQTGISRGTSIEGAINTPLELAILNETSRVHLVIDMIDRVPKLRTKGAHLKEEMKNAIIDNLRYAHDQGTDRPEITNWMWPY